VGDPAGRRLPRSAVPYSVHTSDHLETGRGSSADDPCVGSAQLGDLLLGVGQLSILVAVSALHLRAVIRSSHPRLRTIEALATILPPFLVLFATAYYRMAGASAANFNQSLTRTDAIYFTVTVFATVGFGDITAVSQTARIVVTVQMLLDLLALGLVVRAFLGAVQVAKRRASSVEDPTASSERTRQEGDD